MDSAALVLHSGGLDSTVCLLWALERYDRVETVTFSYGQPHDIEIACAKRIVDNLKAVSPRAADHDILRHEIALHGIYSARSLAETLTVTLTETLPHNQFVIPLRNYLFLTAALPLQMQRAIPLIVIGILASDVRAFVDNGAPFIRDAETLIQTHALSGYQILTPFRTMEKYDVWAHLFANWDHATCDLVIECTHTCFRGNRDRRHPWGYGCGLCGSCTDRANGWVAYKSLKG
jgi:7-cyano-7-deazaguanine synthase